MTIRKTVELESVSLVLLACLCASFFVWWNNQNAQKRFHLMTPINAGSTLQSVITPPANPALKTDTSSQISPDGTKKLIMQTTHNANGTAIYSFSAFDVTQNTTTPLYTATTSGSEPFSLPFNAWSPDNVYVFIQKGAANALVFRATGAPITPDQPYLDVDASFTQKSIPNTPQTVTGWASPTLLIVNSITPNNTTGPSYWYEIPTTAIIPLATQF